MKPAPEKLLPVIVNVNPLGLDQLRRPETLFDWVCSEKEKHPTKVLLVRVGEFYECYGVDAVLLVQHCGLNTMGFQVRAGCPLCNIQQTI